MNCKEHEIHQMVEVASVMEFKSFPEGTKVSNDKWSSLDYIASNK